MPSRHDAVEDYGILFNVKTLVTDDDTTQVADLLLFLASMEKVVGVTIGEFENWMINWWENLDYNVRNNKVMKVRYFSS